MPEKLTTHGFIDSELQKLHGIVVSGEEAAILAESASTFKYPVEKNLTWFLENMSKYRAVVGFISARAEKIHRDEGRKLEALSASKYNNARKAGLTGKLAKAPPAEALKQIVRSDSEIMEQQAVVSRSEYHRDLLRELKDTLQTKSKEVDQICNNMRLEIRTDTERS
jgi:hypothetical protein